MVAGFALVLMRKRIGLQKYNIFGDILAIWGGFYLNNRVFLASTIPKQMLLDNKQRISKSINPGPPTKNEKPFSS